MAILQDPISSDLAGVNSDKELKIALTKDSTKAGYAKMLDGEGDPLSTTENGSLNVSLPGVLFIEQVDGSTLNPNRWSTSTDTMTITQSAGYIILNANSTTTANKYAILQSVKSIPMYGPLPVRVLISAKINIQPQANITVEIGLGSGATNGAPTDGVLFRWNPSAQFLGIVNNAGSETPSSALTAPTSNVKALFEMVIVEDLVQFYVNDTLVSSVTVPAGLAFPTNAGRLPLFIRLYNGSSTPGAAAQLSIGQVIVVQEAMNQNKSWSDTLVSMGMGSYQSPTIFTQTANHANSTNPVSATLSNTAAGYTTLGGRFQFAAVAGAVTDFALFGFQVPAGYQFYITGIAISIVSTGALGSAITPTILDWAIGVNSTAVSLATADGASTVAPRRIPLGMQTFGLTAAIGAMPPDMFRQFLTSVVVDGGRFVHVILQVPVGAATASQIFRGDVTISGYFE